MKTRPHPNLLELNAIAYLRRLSEKYKKKLTLAAIPEKEWQLFVDQGFNLIWLMGVWKRSPVGRQGALKEANLQKAYDAALPGWKEDDVLGSPYAVYDYTLDPHFGPSEDLHAVKQTLNRLGLGLILDYVPNHFALDHAWTLNHPEYFIRGNADELKTEAGSFFETPNKNILAHGKDPNFPAWGDTVQVNYFSPEFRQAVSAMLLKIADMADGLRCDMAMLGITSVFQKTWGKFLKQVPAPEKEFWREMIPQIKSKNPDFIFMAEAYWNLEWELQQQGFDFTYDKKLYDKFLHGSAQDLRTHLQADLEYQNRSVRFIENHDEPRAAEAFGPEKSCAAATIAATLPGLRFFQDGQSEGKKVRLPVQLGREPLEKENLEIKKFYTQLFSYIQSETLHRGKWQLLETAGWEDNKSEKNLLSWIWQQGKDCRLIVVNYSDQPSQGRVQLQSAGLSGDVVQLKDALTGQTYEKKTEELVKEGLHVELGAWGIHLFEGK